MVVKTTFEDHERNCFPREKNRTPLRNCNTMWQIKIWNKHRKYWTMCTNKRCLQLLQLRILENKLWFCCYFLNCLYICSITTHTFFLLNRFKLVAHNNYLCHTLFLQYPSYLRMISCSCVATDRCVRVAGFESCVEGEHVCRGTRAFDEWKWNCHSVCVFMQQIVLRLLQLLAGFRGLLTG